MDFPCDSSELLVGRNGGAHRVVGQHARGDEAASASEGSVNGRNGAGRDRERSGDQHGEVGDIPGFFQDK